MQRITSLWRSGTRGKIMLLVGALLGLCIICAVIGSLTPRQTPPPTASQPGPTTAPAVAQAPATIAPVAQPSATTRPTDPPRPTNTPAPSNTPRPTNTPQPPPPTATPNVGKVGERREAAGVALTVNGVSKTGQMGIFRPQTAGNVFLVLDVTVETTTRDTAPYNPNYFKLKDDSGFEYAITIGAPEPSLKFGNLAKGEKARGNLAFEIKPDAKGLVVSYEPLVLLGGFQPIRIDLGQ